MLEYQLTDLMLTGCRQINLLMLNPALRKKRIVISLPLNVRKVTTEYYKYKFEQACAQLVNQSKTSINVREVPGLLKVRKVKPKDLLEKKKNQVCGSMIGKWLLDTVKEKQKKQQEAKNKKAKDIESFLI